LPGALFSKSFGAGDLDEMKQNIVLSFFFIGAVTLLIYALIFPGTDLILQLLSVPYEIYELMRSYVKIIFIGIGFTFLYNFLHICSGPSPVCLCNCL
jgi:Na+-driven multidrug efflux pump